jgi:hypothetical protein
MCDGRMIRRAFISVRACSHGCMASIGNALLHPRYRLGDHNLIPKAPVAVLGDQSPPPPRWIVRIPGPHRASMHTGLPPASQALLTRTHRSAHTTVNRFGAGFLAFLWSRHRWSRVSKQLAETSHLPDWTRRRVSDSEAIKQRRPHARRKIHPTSPLVFLLS